MNPSKPSFEQGTVESLRARIAAGTYNPDVEAVAGAILDQWSAEVSAYAWLKADDQEVTEPGDSAPERSETSSL